MPATRVTLLAHVCLDCHETYFQQFITGSLASVCSILRRLSCVFLKEKNRSFTDAPLLTMKLEQI